jgi:hypothetical protein
VEVAQRCRARDLLLRRRRIVHCCPGLEISVGGGDGDRMREEPLLVLPDLQRWWQSRETNYSRMSRAVKRRREEARGRIHCRTASRRRAMGLDRTAAMDGERRKLAARRWSRQRGGRRRVATAGCCVSAADATRRAQDRPGFAPPARDIHSSPLLRGSGIRLRPVARLQWCARGGPSPPVLGGDDRSFLLTLLLVGKPQSLPSL